jgi:hypothetical protein
MCICAYAEELAWTFISDGLQNPCYLKRVDHGRKIRRIRRKRAVANIPL